MFFASTGCVRETLHIKKKPALDVSEKLPTYEKGSQHEMCKRNSPKKNNASVGCIREIAQIKNNVSTGCVRETDQIKIKPARNSTHTRTHTHTHQKKKKKSQNGIYKRNSPYKNEASTGCLRETPQIKMKPAWDV